MRNFSAICDASLHLVVGLLALFVANRPAIGQVEGGLLCGTFTCKKSDFAALYQVRSMPFFLACDENTCVSGFSHAGNERYLLARSGNSTVISIDVIRSSGEPFSVDGEWQVSHFVEQSKQGIVDSFESRYRVTQSAAFFEFALPAFLAWEKVGISRSEMKDALRGSVDSISNSCGTIEFSGTDSLESISVKKSANDLFSPGGETLEEYSLFPGGILSIKEEYRFTPPRTTGRFKPFRCIGNVRYVLASGVTHKAEIEIDVKRNENRDSAQRFLELFVQKLPSDVRIVSKRRVATVLDQGEQKIAVDLDVNENRNLKFSNASSTWYYYAIFLTFVLGILAYLRWFK